MNIFKSIGTILTSATNVIVKACTTAETFIDSLEDVALMSKETTGGMLETMKLEQQAEIRQLKADLK
jgi:hypothetical protein